MGSVWYCQFIVRDLPTNPLLRGTVVKCPSVTKLFSINGTPENTCEKLIPLVQSFIHKLAKPGDKMLVIGAGSGAELIPGLQSGLDVVGLKRDRKQYDAINTRKNMFDAVLVPGSSRRVTGADEEGGDGKSKQAAEVSAEI